MSILIPITVEALMVGIRYMHMILKEAVNKHYGLIPFM